MFFLGFDAQKLSSNLCMKMFAYEGTIFDAHGRLKQLGVYFSIKSEDIPLEDYVHKCFYHFLGRWLACFSLEVLNSVTA